MNRPALLVSSLVFAVALLAMAWTPQIAQGQEITKRCSGCGSLQDPGAQVGDNCSSCGAYFSEERQLADSGGSCSGEGYPAFSRPITPMEAMAMCQLALFRERQMLRQYCRDQLRARRQEELARRERNRVRLAEQSLAWTAEDPAQRVGRFLRTAASCEERGQYQAAAAYYRLVLRTLPDSELADQAELGLDLIESR